MRFNCSLEHKNEKHDGAFSSTYVQRLEQLLDPGLAALLTQFQAHIPVALGKFREDDGSKHRSMATPNGCEHSVDGFVRLHAKLPPET